MKKRLVLLMNDYPYGTGDKTFMDPEITYLQEKFHLIIVSTSESDELTSEINADIPVFHFKIQFNKWEKIKYVFKFIFHMYGLREIVEIVKRKENILARIRDSIGFYACAEKLYSKLKKHQIITKEQKNYIYSYWCHINCMAVILHKERYHNMKIVTRLHGYDLYEERNYYGRQPFRTLLHKRIDKMIFVAEEAKDYYLRTWRKLDISLCEVYKLGIINEYPNIIKYQKSEEMLLISCSHIIDLKRIDLIILALSKIEHAKIKWVHFGEGNDAKKIKELAQKELACRDNIKYEFKNHVNNDIIKQYYADNVIDCFITTSESEGGCPVSIQEAMSFGIPIIGTMVGGIPSMIQGNGILLSDKCDVKEITEAIINIRNMEEKDILEMRKNSKNIWEQEYNAKLNSRRFIEYIDKVFND